MLSRRFPESLSFARSRRVPVLLARVIYLSALARSFPQPRVKDLTSHHLDRPPSFSPPYLLAELFLSSLCPFRLSGRESPLYPASSLISFARRWIGERRFFHTDIDARNRHSPIAPRQDEREDLLGFLADNGPPRRSRSILERATNRDDPLVMVNIVYRRKVMARGMIDSE